jgi:hypothetical protein
MPAKQVRDLNPGPKTLPVRDTSIELDLAKTIRAAGGGAADELILKISSCYGTVSWYLQQTLLETCLRKHATACSLARR